MFIKKELIGNILNVFGKVLCIYFIAGCTSENFEDCLLNASKLNTSEGVELAAHVCKKKFENPPTEVDKIIEKSLKCDRNKLDKYATYIVNNESLKNSEDFNKVEEEYKKIKILCKIP